MRNYSCWNGCYLPQFQHVRAVHRPEKALDEMERLTAVLERITDRLETLLDRQAATET